MVGLWLAVARRDDGVGTAACGCPRVVGLAAARTRGRLGSHFAAWRLPLAAGALARQYLFFLFFYFFATRGTHPGPGKRAAEG